MRPRIICHLVSSIDGRLLADRWTPSDADPIVGAVPSRHERLGKRLAADGVIVGRSSLEALSFVKAGESKSGPRRKPAAYLAARKGRKLAVVIDPEGKLHYGSNDAEGSHIVAVLADGAPEDYLAALRAAGVSYLFAGADGQDLGGALAQIGEAFQVETLLLEGGGRLNSAFMNAGLIDEISLLVCPVIDDLPGGLNTGEYAGTLDDSPAAERSLRHLGTETLGAGLVWLRYEVEADYPLRDANTVFATGKADIARGHPA
jgi:5-amino-6-(5-phosphoribosylamino)uracil reductase